MEYFISEQETPAKKWQNLTYMFVDNISLLAKVLQFGLNIRFPASELKNRAALLFSWLGLSSFLAGLAVFPALDRFDGIDSYLYTGYTGRDAKPATINKTYKLNIK